MKRRIAIVLLLLVGGAIVNVAVAWGCLLYSAPRGGCDLGPFPFDSLGLSEPDGKNERLEVSDECGFGYELRWIDWVWEDHAFAFRNVAVRIRCGWPWMTLTGHSRDAGRSFYGALPTTMMEHRVEGYLQGESGAFIPHRPLVTGSIGNTLFYALLLWLLFFAPFTARRILRRRRGLCEKCAYPIGVSPVCTECGAAVRPLVARSS